MRWVEIRWVETQSVEAALQQVLVSRELQPVSDAVLAYRFARELELLSQWQAWVLALDWEPAKRLHHPVVDKSCRGLNPKW